MPDRGIKPTLITAPADEFVEIDAAAGASYAGGVGPANGFKVYVGNTGSVKVDGAVAGTAITFQNAQQGSVLPILVKKVYGSGDGTTATGLIACW